MGREGVERQDKKDIWRGHAYIHRTLCQVGERDRDGHGGETDRGHWVGRIDR